MKHLRVLERIGSWNKSASQSPKRPAFRWIKHALELIRFVDVKNSICQLPGISNQRAGSVAIFAMSNMEVTDLRSAAQKSDAYWQSRCSVFVPGGPIERIAHCDISKRLGELQFK
jgi:hypothetical protein